MKTFKVTVASTIYYQAEVEAELMEEIEKDIRNGDLDFTEWREVDLDSHIYDIVEVK